MNKTKPNVWMEQKIRNTIPLSEFMGFSIVNLQVDLIETYAPFDVNLNIHGTGFAGSIYSLGVLTGWALCSYNMHILGMDGDLVVGDAQIRYRSAITDDIECFSSISQSELAVFNNEFIEKGKSKLCLDIVIGSAKNAILSASYYAVLKEGEN